MKRLFEVVPPDGKERRFFDSKEKAKKVRDSLKGDAHVTLGPDHYMYGVTGNARTHSNARAKVAKK